MRDPVFTETPQVVFSGISVAYTDRELGVITEIFSGTPGAD